MRFRPAFAVLRPGQENIQRELAAALAHAIEQLYNGSDASAQLGDAGRAHVLAHYTRARWTRFYHDAFEKITAARKGEGAS